MRARGKRIEREEGGDEGKRKGRGRKRMQGGT